MLHYMWQNWFTTRWKHSAEKSYPTAYSPGLVSFDYHLFALSSALVRTMMWKNGSMNGSQQKGTIFTDVVFTNCTKDGENVQQAMEHTTNEELFIILSNLTGLSMIRISYSYNFVWQRYGLWISNSKTKHSLLDASSSCLNESYLIDSSW